MLYFADGERPIDREETLADITSTLAKALAEWERNGAPSLPHLHSQVVGATIALGELHQAVADALCPDEDSISPHTDSFGDAGTLLGRCVFANHQLLGHENPRTSRYSRLLAEALDAVQRLSSLDLPFPLTARIPEGYAFYSLYPEMYFASLSRLVQTMASAHGYFVVGVRSIGTSLGALVAGALAEMGNDVHFETVRPRGHPFDRFLKLSRDLQKRITSNENRVFVVVDEGPGLTCSSLLSVCLALEGLGIPSRRIAILSAWEGVPSIYASEETRSRWKSQQVFHTSAADAFDGWRALFTFVGDAVAGNGGGRSTITPEAGWNLRDLSYGMWRQICYESTEEWPTVHRPSERTKLLLTPPNDARRDDTGETFSALLAKFAGLGKYGEAKFRRARCLAEADFAPRVEGYAYGFVLSQFVDGRPMTTRDLSTAVIERMAAYYSFICNSFETGPEPQFDRLAEMLSYNSRAAGLDATGFLRRWGTHSREIDELSLVELDGRPFPHEWIEVKSANGIRLLKTDGADHFLDHTLVGRQSILWDLAGACEEWEMSPSQRKALLESCIRAARGHIPERFLEFFRAAYLAFRTAALHYAIHSTNEEEIRRQLQDQQVRTNTKLATVLQG